MSYVTNFWVTTIGSLGQSAFIDKQLGAIVGIEIALTKLIGKWKVSQNRPDMDREGVIESLSKRGDADSAAIAKWVKEKLQS